MTLPELAERLGLKSVGSLRAQILRGALHADKVGRDWVVSVDEASRYEREHRGRRGFANADHPMHGKQGPGRRRKGSGAGGEGEQPNDPHEGHETTADPV